MEKSIFNGYQIVGASNMVRFCSTVLKNRPSKTQGLNNGCPTVDLCISGQRIRGLQNRLKKFRTHLSQNIIVCIGTNDVIHMKPVKGFKAGLRTITQILRGHNVVWVTVPPMPKFEGSELHCRRIRQYNKAITKLEKLPNQRVIDLWSFCHEDKKIKLELFTKYYKRPRNQAHLPPKKDGIHFSPTGLYKMAMWLKKILNN